MTRSEARKKLLDVLPSAEEMAATIESLHSMNDAATILTSAAFLDNAVEMMLKAIFRPLSKDDERRLFDSAQNGILGTFSAKIRIAYAEGIVGPSTYNDLLLINAIRNTVAHSLRMNVDFDNPHIIADCDKLRSLDEFAPKDYSRRSSPKVLFIETVRNIYSLFTMSARMTMYMRHGSDEMQRDDALSPSRRKPRQRSRRKTPTASE